MFDLDNKDLAALISQHEASKATKAPKASKPTKPAKASKADKPAPATTVTLKGRQCTLVGTFRVYWGISGEVYSDDFSHALLTWAQDIDSEELVDVLDHTGWREEDPKYKEEDLWLEEDGENIYLRCGTSDLKVWVDPAG